MQHNSEKKWGFDNSDDLWIAPVERNEGKNPPEIIVFDMEKSFLYIKEPGNGGHYHQNVWTLLSRN